MVSIPEDALVYISNVPSDIERAIVINEVIAERESSKGTEGNNAQDIEMKVPHCRVRVSVKGFGVNHI